MQLTHYLCRIFSASFAQDSWKQWLEFKEVNVMRVNFCLNQCSVHFVHNGAGPCYKITKVEVRFPIGRCSVISGRAVRNGSARKCACAIIC